MEDPLRREPWRRTHRRLLDKHRRGGGSMSRTRVPVVRGGQGRAVEVRIRGVYTPMEWDDSEPRVQTLMAYRPKFAPQRWTAHRNLVLDLVLRTDYSDKLGDRHLAGTLHHFLVWCEDRHFSTDPAQVLSGDRMDLFVTETWANESSRRTHRWRLRHIAATIFPPAPETPMVRNPARAPHSEADMQRHLAAAEQIIAGHHAQLNTRQAMHRDVICVLALTYGAGCDAKTVHRVQEKWLVEHDDGLWLHRPDKCVPIPVAEPWATMLLSALTGRPDVFVVRPDNNGKRNEQVGKVMSNARPVAPGLSGFDCDRAAKAWLRTLLTRAGFAHIALAMAIRPGSQLLGDMAEHLPRPEMSETMTALRGWAQ